MRTSWVSRVLLVAAVTLCAPAAALAAVVTITSPASGTVVQAPASGTAVTVTFTLQGWAVAPGGKGLLWYLDGALDGTHYATTPYTFANVPKGLHRLSVVPVDAGGAPLDAERDSVVVIVSPPCAADADCDDGNACSVERCRPAAGGARCTYVGLPGALCCNSAFDCAVGAQCVGGQCAACVADADCDDANPCTADTCTAGACGHAPVAGCCLTDADCDDANTCTADTCDATTHTCQHAVVSAPGCCATASDCDDGNACTIDACSPLHTCRHAPKAACCLSDADCDDGNACTVDACDLATNTCTHDTSAAPPGCCNADADCVDGNPCTVDTCDAATHTCQHAATASCCQVPADCDDANPCTVDRCIAQACVHLPHPGISGCCVTAADCADDGNPCTTASCDANVCVQVPVDCPAPLPWQEGFAGASLADASMNATAVGDSSRWVRAADATATLTFDAPAGSTVTQRLEGPMLDASAAVAPLTLEFLSTITGVDAGQTATLSVEVSADGGATWTTVWQRTLADGDLARTAVTLDASALAGHPQVKVAWVCTGACTGGGTWSVDDLRLGEGLAPAANPVPDATVPENVTGFSPLGAADADTPQGDLAWNLVDGPAFAFLLQMAPSGAIVAFAPVTGDIGLYPVRARVDDGFFYDEAAFSVVVVPGPTGGGGGGILGDIAQVIIRDAPGGAGQPVGDVTLSVGDTLTLYAAGYDALLQYVQDVPVLWESTGGLDPVPAGPSSSVTLSASKGGVSGKVLATHTNPKIAGDETGIITVTPQPPTGPSAPDSTLVASKAALVADGADTLTLTVIVRDATGTLFTGPATVAFQTTAGTLLGNVVDNGDGTYSQVLQAAASPVVATVSATVDGQPVANTLQIPMDTVIDLVGVGVTVIDCNNYADYAGADLLIANGTVEIDSAGCAPMVFGDVHVGTGGVLTHAAANGANTERIDIEVDSLTVDPGGVIDVSGKGWPAGKGYKGLAAHAPCNHCGGSHGGRGGHSAWASNPPPVYDRLDAPLLPGEGGAGAAGGGVVHVKVTKPTGAVVIYGTVKANGAGSTVGGGAGGAVWFDTPRLSGTGSIEARGGNGNGWCGGNCSGGGGGGRVAITGASMLTGAFSFDSGLTSIHVAGGTGWNGGGAGTIFVKRTTDTYGSLIVDNEGHASDENSTPLVDPGSGDWEAVSAGALTDDDRNPMDPDFFAGWWLRPDVGANATPTLLDDTVVRIVGNDAHSFVPDADGTAVASVGGQYTPIYRFDNVEVRGKARLQAPGALLVREGDIASGDATTLVVDGSLRTGTLDAGDVDHVEVLNGIFEAQLLVSHSVTTFPVQFGASSGGLVLGDATASSMSLVSSTLDAGSLDVVGSFTMKGGSGSAASIAAGGHVTLRGGADLTVGAIQATALNLADANTVLRHPAAGAGPPATALDVTVQAATIGAGAAIDASGRGWPAGIARGGTSAFGSTGRSGGSHGGIGGLDWQNHAAGPVYGDLYHPAQPGGGGGPDTGGGNGGGVVRLVVNGPLVVDGAIRANGANHNRGGGAGGSIWIDAVALSGSGSIEANGGNGNGWCGSECSAGGGGGRIALYATSLAGGFDWPAVPDHVHAHGGSGYRPGGAGTIYIKRASQPWGDLLVSNDGLSAAEGTTPLVGAGRGVTSGVDPAGIEDLTANWETDWFVGSHVHAVGQGDPNTLADDTVFRVDSNTATVLSLDQDPSAVFGAGDAYSAIWVFDNLEVRGNARLKLDGDLLVLGGDATSGDDTTLVLDGSLDAHTVDVHGVQTVEARNGIFSVQVLLGGGQADPLIDYTFTSDTVEVPHVVAKNVTVHGGSLHTATIAATDAVRFDGGAVVTLDGGTLSGTTLVLADAGTMLTQKALAAGDPVVPLDIQVASATVEAGAAIDVTGRGWPAGISWGGTAKYATTGRSGGSHGGLGGLDWQNHAVGLAFGSVTHPDQPGGGGGPDTGGGAGGGVVRLHVTGTLLVDGAIRANGQTHNRGGGAGGAVWVTASTLNGQGTIEARGGSGNGWCGSECSAGGGGGRIAIYADLLSGGFAWPDLPGHVQAQGGNGWQPGGAGTIYVHTAGQAWGDLLVDNAGLNAREGSTPLPAAGVGDLEAVDASGADDTDATWVPGLLVDSSIHLVDEGDAGTLADDTFFGVTGNTGTHLDLDADPTAVLGVGSSYAAVWVFDNLEIRGRARVSLDGDLRVVGGDAVSGDDTTWRADGSLSVGTFDLAGVQTVHFSNGVLTADRILGGGQIDPRIDYTFVQAAVNLPHLVANSVDVQGGSLDTDHIDVTATASLSAGAVVTLTGGQLTATTVALSDAGTVLRPESMVAGGPIERLHVSATSMSVGAGAAVDASGRGWPAGISWGGNPDHASTGRSGGSHGGLGGLDWQNHPVGLAFGSLTHPDQPGGGGGPDTGGGAGGGVIRLEITGTLLVDGAVRANGQTHNRGGGAGGAVWVTASTLNGQGTIEARGGSGNGWCGSECSAGGGGGRIAIYADLLSGGFAWPDLPGHVKAQGGNGWQPGGAGTIYVHTTGQPWGDLLVDNAGLSAREGSTPLPAAGAGDLEAVDVTGVDDTDATWVSGLLGDSFIHLVDEGAAGTLADDTVFGVTGNTGTHLDLDADPTAVLAVGSSYSALWVFDNLELRGKARVSLDGDLRVLGGDRTSGDDTTWVAQGSLVASTVDFAGVQTIQVSDGRFQVDRILGGGQVDPVIDYTFVNSDVQLAAVVAKNLTAQGGTLTTDRLDVTATCALSAGAVVTLTGGQLTATTLTLADAGTVLRPEAMVAGGPIERLHVTATSVTVGAGASIDASARGWPAGISWGGNADRASTGRSGGSHGGLGGLDWQNHAVGLAFGSVTHPDQPGGGGGPDTGGGTGGGVVRLDVTGTLVVDGAIRANGQDHNRGGGAGGAVWVTASTLNGQGTIEARGGNGNGWCGSECSSGGGGGRIAIYADLLSGGFAWPDLPGHVKAQGGNGWRPGGAGTIYVHTAGQAWGDLLVDNAGLNAEDGTTPLPSPGTGDLEGVTAAGVDDTDATWTPGLFVDTAIHRVDEGDANTLLDDTVLPVTGNATTHLDLATDPSAVLGVGDAYAGLWVVDNLEVRGRARLLVDGDLLVLGGDRTSGDDTTLVVDGSLQAGTVDIQAVDNLHLGNGTFHVARLLGAGQVNPPIDLTLDATNTDLPDVSVRNLTVSGGTLTTDTIAVSQTLALAGGAAVTVRKGTVTATTLSLLDAGTVLTHPAAQAGAAAPSLSIVATSLTVGPGAAIDVDAKGWPAGVGPGGDASLASTGRSGGSHGGLGGLDWQSHAVGPVYDSVYQPHMAGGGGGPDTGGGAGGGIVRVVVSGSLLVDGVIRANGQNHNRGGGAGGAIWIAAGALTGNGSIEARGGNGNGWCGSECSSGGGGGRIAIEYTSLGGGFAWPTTLDHVHAQGGNGWQPGGAGTIYLKAATQAWGDLLVDNAGLNAREGSTPLVGVGVGSVSGLTATTLTDLAAVWSPGSLVGTRLHRVDEGDPATLADDTVFEVTANTGTELTLDGDPTAVFAPGDAYAALWTFDDLEVRGNARLSIDGDLRVLSGDWATGDDATLVGTGSLAVGTFDVGPVSVLDWAQGHWQPGRLLADVGASGVDLTCTQCEIAAGDLVANNLTLTGGHALVDTIGATNMATLRGGAVVEVRNTTVTATTLKLVDNGTVLRHVAPDAGVSPVSPKTLEITATTVFVEAGAAIDVSGDGWPVGIGWDGTAATASLNRAGGSHGGVGGKDAWGNAPGVAYGNLYAPLEPGEGAGSGNGGGWGGGVVHIVAAGTVTVNGAIRANGASHGGGGGGAGGSIFIEAGQLDGSGEISAIGGDGNNWCGGNCSGGGGGGRIAIYHAGLAGGFAWPDLPAHVHAQGGAGWAHGGAGTIYVKADTQTWGDLLVDNAGRNAATPSTVLLGVGGGTSSSLSATVLEDVTATWEPGRYAGYLVDPNIAQGGTTSRLDDTVYTILDNTYTTLTVDLGPMTDVAATGDPYRGIYVFDHLELRGNARVATEAGNDVVVLNGDRHSAAGAFDVPSGSSLEAALIELAGIQQANITGTITANDALLCADCP